jgi:hypothetical protein
MIGIRQQCLLRRCATKGFLSVSALTKQKIVQIKSRYPMAFVQSIQKIVKKLIFA